MRQPSYYEECFEGYRAGFYHPAKDEISLSEALGRPYYTRAAICHIETHGKHDGTETGPNGQVTIRVTGPRRSVVMAHDLRADEKTPYSIPLLIKRHIVLSHELTHRRLALDTSLGFVLRFFGLGKIYLAGHRDAIGHAERYYLEHLASSFDFLIATWRPLQEYIADYCTLIEIDELLLSVSHPRKPVSCECGQSDFVKSLSAMSPEEVIAHLQQIRHDLGNAHRLKNIPAFSRRPMKLTHSPAGQHLGEYLSLQATKLDFVKLYALIYLASSFPFSEFNFALSPPGTLQTKMEAYSPNDLIRALLRTTEGVAADDVLRTLAAGLFLEDRKELWTINPLIGRADYIQRQACKERYRDYIAEAEHQLRFDFFEFVRSHLIYADDRCGLDPFPTINEVGQPTEYHLLDRADHMSFMESYSSPLKEEYLTGGRDWPRVPEEPKERPLTDDYALNLIYKGMMSTTLYNRGSGFFPIRDGQHLIADLIGGGHDIGSVLSMCFGRQQ